MNAPLRVVIAVGLLSGIWGLLIYSQTVTGIPDLSNSFSVLRYYWFGACFIGPIIGLVRVSILLLKKLTNTWRIIVGLVVVAVSVQPLQLLISLALVVLLSRPLSSGAQSVRPTIFS